MYVFKALSEHLKLLPLILCLSYLSGPWYDNYKKASSV